MYKPPENTNRVQAIKNIFETSGSVDTNGLGNRNCYVNRSFKRVDNNSNVSSINLTRQLSDPSRRNIKRTPAFRLDKSLIVGSKSPPASGKLILKNRIEQFEKQSLTLNGPYKSDEDNDCFNASRNNDSISRTPLLYTEPIPKSLRVREESVDETYAVDSNGSADDVHTASTLKIGDVSTNRNVNDLNDTLRRVLKLPLPPGPAPRKPPRTFTHTAQCPFDVKDNYTANNGTFETVNKIKSDPKYMLDKLEFALRNNRIRKSPRNGTDDDDDDNSKHNKLNFEHVPLPTSVNKAHATESNIYTIPSARNVPNNSLSALNCLSSMGCGTTYDVVDASKSRFFVNSNSDEPLYAQPFEYLPSVCLEKKPNGDLDENLSTASSANVRRSLHYMSNPVPVSSSSTMKESDSIHQVSSVVLESPPSSSLSTSDFDSLTSTPTDSETKTLINTSSNKIKDMINAFEQKLDISDPVQCKKNDSKVFSKKDCVRFGHERKPKVFVDSTDDELGNKDVSPDMTVKFRNYVKRVRSTVYREPIIGRHAPRLFHCCLLVGLNESTSTPYIKTKFPTEVEIPTKMEELCFPDSETSLTTIDSTQCYSLVITNSLGDRMFGYCRRVLPEGCTTCLPLAYCILSPIKAPGFYGKVLKELESRHGLPDKIKNDFVNVLYRSKFPRPGESVKVDFSKIYSCINGDNDKENAKRKGVYGTLNSAGGFAASAIDSLNDKKNLSLMRHSSLNVEGGEPTKVTGCDVKKSSSSSSMLVLQEEFPNELVLTRPFDSRYEDTNFSLLFDTLSVSLLLQIFSSLLLERKVVLVSSMLSTLSTCIEALQSALYPFSWPHTLIPILPESLWEILEAPTPLLCGTLSTQVARLYHFEYGIIVDLDTSTIVKSMGDEAKILPSGLARHFRKGLDLAKAMPSPDTSRNILVGDAFIRVFVHSCGHYRDHINDHVFQKESFVSDQKCKLTRKFLKWFTETTMFITFIESATRESAFHMFDQKIQIYTSKESDPIFNKMINQSKTKKTFF